ncbi:uncharacterized protein LOC113344629 [Papaver somniferum]|uniref:uncharacterized protein LOC113344629 n=1 Tax=Papaver somniferum TaxID=3469 RepID=UPI000E6FF678|nr:uncharacterized protein LOC113344629 [Papaver somniferum]
MSNQGSKPYRYFKCWSSDPSVREVINNAYSKYVRGSYTYKLANRLRFVKHDLKLWNVQHFGNIDHKVKTLNNQLNDLIKLPYSSENVELIKQVEFDLKHWQKIQEEFYAQKSRQEYFKCFDRNTGFYHNYANRRKHFNHISVLKLYNGQWDNDRVDLKTLLVNHFSSIGTTSNPYRNTELLNCIDPCISDIDNLTLLRPVNKQKIIDTINQMTPWTSLGPDVFPPGYLIHAEENNLIHGIKEFSMASGQVINLQKSGCFFSNNVHHDHAFSLINNLKVKKIALNEKYLGLPLFITRSLSDSFNYLNDHFDKRVAKWKGKHFNQAGRSVVVQNVLKSSPIYHMHTFTILDSIINSMESSQRYFCWGKSRTGGIYFRSWPRICTHKYQGGLGFRNLKHVNLFLLSKTAWKLIHNPNDMWVVILRCKYFENCHPLHYSKKGDYSWAWRSISRGLDFILKHSIWKVKDGKSICAFRDRWIPDSCEPMFVANPNPNLNFSAFIDNETKSRNSELVREFFIPNNTKNILDSRIPLSWSDRLIWPHSKNGQFTVKSTCKVISGQIDYMNNVQSSNPFYKALWRFSVLPNVKIFIWKCHENILPSNSVLARFVNRDNNACSMCNSDSLETPVHILLHCLFGKSVWSLTPYADIIAKDNNSSINLQTRLSNGLLTTV